MNTFLTVILIIFTIFVLFQIWVFVKAKRNVGNKFPFEKFPPELSSKIKDKRGLIYFYSPKCHNCRFQTPIIEKLKKSYDSIVSMNIAEDLDLARELNVMATPSVMLLNGNKVIGYYVGVKKESFLISKLISNE